MTKCDKLRTDYTMRIRECGDDSFLRLRAAEWLLDSSTRIVKEVRDDNQGVLEKAIRDQANAKQLLTHIHWQLKEFQVYKYNSH